MIRAAVVSILLLFALIGAHATGTVEITPTRTVVDALGRTVEVPADPERIVTAGSAVLMIADALYLFPGASERIIGIGRINQGKGNFLAAIDDAYNQKTTLERSVGPEQIASLSPDLVIIKALMRERLGDGLERLGIPVVYVDLESPEQYQRDLRLLGEVLGQPDRGIELARYFESRVTEVEQQVAGAQGAGATSPRTLFLYADSTGGEQVFNVPPATWIQTTIVEIAGGEPVWTDEPAGGGWSRVGFEQIAAWNPDVITLVAYRQDVSDIRAALLEDPSWTELDAVQRGNLRVFPVDFYSWDQPDVRWILGLQWLATILYPDQTQIDIGNELYEFFSFAYGMSRSEVDAIIVPILEGLDL
jgi:iron complex transport system substrate-binding protein